MKEYVVVIEKGASSYGAYVPDLEIVRFAS
jgi:hypothetical protein